MRGRRAVIALAVCPVILACSRDDGGSVDRDPRALDVPVAEPSQPAYRVVPLGDVGRLTGQVEVNGDVRDSAAVVTRDNAYCGDRIPEGAVVRRGDRLAGVIVWLSDARTGKAFPASRRFEVTNQRCMLVPRVQATVVGGTLNVKSADPIPHRTLVRSVGSTRTLDTVAQNGEGQVVPLENILDRPGRLELRCELHPWTRGYILIFDHPYFAVSGLDGGFAIDSVPPGDYTLVTWHERLGTTQRRVRIDSGMETRLRIDE